MVKLILDEAFNKVKTIPKATNHDAVFLFGDLNFRVDLENSKARQAVKEKKLQYLQQFDELNQLRNSFDQVSAGMAPTLSNEVKEAISQDQYISYFKEGEINFTPTYKYDRGTHTFDSSRK